MICGLLHTLKGEASELRGKLQYEYGCFRSGQRPYGFHPEGLLPILRFPIGNGGGGAYGAQPGVASVLLPMLPVLLIAEFICIIVLSFTRRTSGVNVALYIFSREFKAPYLGRC